jgi:hypothetical protein
MATIHAKGGQARGRLRIRALIVLLAAERGTIAAEIAAVGGYSDARRA